MTQDSFVQKITAPEAIQRIKQSPNPYVQSLLKSMDKAVEVSEFSAVEKTLIASMLMMMQTGGDPEKCTKFVEMIDTTAGQLQDLDNPEFQSLGLVLPAIIVNKMKQDVEAEARKMGLCQAPPAPMLQPEEKEQLEIDDILSRINLGIHRGM